MNLIKTSPFYIVLSLICAIGVFPMSMIFQMMGYWGNGLIWYWIGVIITYSIFLVGVAFLILAVIKRNESNSLLVVSLSFISCILLVTGFLWTTFIIIAGMSGF